MTATDNNNDDDTEQSSSSTLDEAEERATYTSTILPLSIAPEAPSELSSSVSENSTKLTTSLTSNSEDSDSSHHHQQQQNDEPMTEHTKVDESFRINSSNISKAVRFLKHPSIATLPRHEKISFLHSKGVADDEIQIAEMKVGINQEKTSTGMISRSGNIYAQSDDPPTNISHRPSTGITSTHHYTTSQSTQSSEDLPSPVVPLTIGGFIAIFGLATWRWLNGGDFVIFPPSSSCSSSLSQILPKSNQFSAIDQSQHTSKGPEKNNISSDISRHLNAKHDHSPVVSDEQVDMETKWVVDEEQTCEVTKEMEFLQTLTGELRCLTEAIERNTSIQERKMKRDMEERSKKMTDKSMDLLRDQSNKEPPVKSSLSSKDPMVLDKLEELSESLKKLEQNVTEKSGGRNHKGGKEIDDDVSFDSSHPSTSNPSELSSDEPDIKANTVKLQSMQNDHKHMNQCNKTTSSTVNSATLSQALYEFSQSNDKKKVKTCSQMLFLYINNLVSDPSQLRYRKIYTNNKTFKDKVGSVKNAKEILLAIGFVDCGSYLEWSENELCADQVENIINEKDEANSVNGAMLLLKEATAALGCLKIDGTCEGLQRDIPVGQQSSVIKNHDLSYGLNGEVGGFLSPPAFVTKVSLKGREKEDEVDQDAEPRNADNLPVKDTSLQVREKEDYVDQGTESDITDTATLVEM